MHTNADPCDGRCATEIDVLSPLWLRSDGRPEAPDNPQLGLHAATRINNMSAGGGLEPATANLDLHLLDAEV